MCWSVISHSAISKNIKWKQRTENGAIENGKERQGEIEKENSEIYQ